MDMLRIYIAPATRRIANDDAHRPRRIGLRLSDARHSREHGSTGWACLRRTTEQTEEVMFLDLPSRLAKALMRLVDADIGDMRERKISIRGATACWCFRATFR
jgi:hypothetical protein